MRQQSLNGESAWFLAPVCCLMAAGLLAPLAFVFSQSLRIIRSIFIATTLARIAASR